MPPSRASSALILIVITLGLSAAGTLAQEDPADLIQARALYQRDVEFVSRPIRDRYVTKLETLKRTLGSRGEAKAAAAVQDEIDRVKATVPEPGAEKLAGHWHIAYMNGGTRRYVISQDGFVTLSEMDGKPVNPPLKAKLAAKGADFLLELESGKIERLKITGKKLSIEHFSTKALFESGNPNIRGTGTLLSARKE